MQSVKECYLDNECSLTCEDEFHNVFPVRMSKRLPADIQEHYIKCRSETNETCTENPRERANVKSFLEFNDEEMARWESLIREKLNITDFVVVKILGVGSYGVTVWLCNPQISPDGFVVKVSINAKNTRERFRAEFEAQRVFARHGLAPKPLFYHIDSTKTGFTFMLMHKLHGGILVDLLEEDLTTNELNIIVNKLIQLINRMCKLGLSHRDLHYANIGYDNLDVLLNITNLHLQVIDFGFAKTDECNERLEYVQLIRFSIPMSYSTLYYRNMFYMHGVLTAYYCSRFGTPKFDMDDGANWDKLYHHLLQKSNHKKTKTQKIKRSKAGR